MNHAIIDNGDKMKNTEIFYFDVDGTLLNNTDHTVSNNTVKSLNMLKDKGYKVALCTGRNYGGIVEANVLDLIEWDGFVLANGSLVLDRNKKIIFESQMEHDLIKRIDDAIVGPLILEGAETFCTKKPNQRLEEAIKHFGLEDSIVIKPHTDEIVYNMICYSFEEITGDLLTEINEKCLLMKDQLGNMEMIPANSGKHYGTKVLNKHLNVERFTGFGDGENDVLFLKEATHSVAMGNGVQNVKDVSSYTTKDVSEDGIHHALLHFGIL